MPRPTDIKLHQKSRVLELVFDDGFECNLTCEYLRVNSPSAEVQGHGPGQEVLQFGKQDVGISNLEPSGNYALKIHFDDGHDTGLFTWEYLYGLGKHYEENWQRYLEKLTAAGKDRRSAG
ncbi:MAG: gamma-butyrobetaine hydroxylase-like domain-containing protein [Granulosicoccus sp.]